MLAVVRLTLAALLAAGCATQPTPTPPSSPPAAAPADAAQAETSPPQQAEPGPEPVATATPLPDDQRAILEEINDRYDEETNPKAWTARFEKEGREVRDKQTEILAELKIAKGSSVADVGAGTGLYTLPFAEAVGSEGHVYAVDVQAYFLDHIRQKATKAGHEHVTPIKASASSAELPEAAVDLVFMCDAYHHVEQPHAYLQSLRAALAPGGRLVIVDYRRGPEGTWRHGHIRATPSQFRAEIEAAGFELEREVDLLDDNFFFVFRVR